MKQTMASNTSVRKIHHKILLRSGPSVVVHLAISALAIATDPSSVHASPCYPNDPDGSNPGNLCLTYPAAFTSSFDPQPQWSPLPHRPINQPPFIQGVGKEAYYGYAVSPTQPGRVVGTTSGYWTNVEAVNGSTTLKDSRNNSISIR